MMPWRTLAAWKRLGRRHYAANAGLARGFSARPASIQKYRGGAQCVVPCVSLSQQFAVDNWGNLSLRLFATRWRSGLQAANT
jgi:hypothetical protein